MVYELYFFARNDGVGLLVGFYFLMMPVFYLGFLCFLIYFVDIFIVL